MKIKIAQTILVAGAMLFAGCKKSGMVDVNAQSETNHINPFKSVEYYPAPNQTRMKTQLSGADAQPLEGGLLAIKQLKIETFSTNGQPQAVATAPDCIYDSPNRLANSPGQLFLQNGDGKIRAEGEGFLWRQNESSLTISNNVKTFIASMALAAATGLNAAPTNSDGGTNSVLISAQRGDFDMTAHHAIYSGDVHVTDPQMKLTCEWLIADLPQSGRINHIVAETNVAIDFMQNNETTHAIGEKAEYNYAVANGVTNETVKLTGNPQVEGVRGGTLFTNWGDEIIWNRANNGIQVINPMTKVKNVTVAGSNTNQLSKPKTNLPPGTIENIDDIKIKDNTP